MTSDIRVLLIEETKERGTLGKLLAGGSVVVSAEAGYGPEAVSAAQSSQPDVIVIALDEPVARPLRTVEILTVAAAGAGIVVVSSTGDRDVMHKAVRAGARDYLVKPVGRDDLQRAVQEVHEAEQKRRRMGEPAHRDALHTGDLFVLFGAKGGIGKTTLSVNLATAIANETKQRVALVDLDVQMGDVALMLNVVPERSIADAATNADRLEAEFLESLVYPDSSGVRVLAAPLSPEDSVDITSTQIGQVIDTLTHTFDYVVVDTSPTLNDLNLVAIEKATLTLVITAPELPSIKRTKISLNLLLKTWNYQEERVKLVVNHPYPQNGLLPRDIESTLDYPIFWKLPYDPSVGHAIKTGRPVVELDPRSRYSRNVVELARGLCGLTVPQIGLFTRLLKI
jgi:pilus assembly protein CpaE